MEPKRFFGEMVSRAAGHIAGELAKLDRPEFQYDSLHKPTNIRLLFLDPRTDDHLVHCRLEQVNFDTNPAFEALSYTWKVDHSGGKPTLGNKRTIICNGRQMQILENLFHGLRQLQKSRMVKGPIWIDAICINQSDDVEKNVQVKMMGKIFEAATRVIVWLGRASPATELILDLAEPLLTGEISSWVDGADDETTDSLWDDACNIVKVALPLKALSRLLRRGWFCRVWTLQEAILARELVYLMGPRQVPIGDFMEIMGDDASQFDEMSKYVDFMLKHFRSRMKGIEFVNESRKSRSKHVSCTLEEAITEARNRKAGNLRDKVFAVLSLCSTVELNEAGRLAVDYQKSVQDVFCDCAIALLESKRTGLFLLSLVGQIRHGSPVEKVFSSSRIESWTPEGNLTPDLPSWVPDLNAPTRPVPLREISKVQYSAAIELKSCFKVSGGTVLNIRAALLGKVTVVGDSLSYKVWHRPLWKFLRVPCHLDGKTYRPTGEPMVSAFWRTLLAGSTHVRDDEGYKVPLSDSHFCSWFIVMAREGFGIWDDDMRNGILKEGEDEENEEDEEEEWPTNLPSLMEVLNGFRGDHFKELLQGAGASVLGAAIERINIHKKISDARQLIAEGANTENKINAVRQFILQFDTPEYGLRSGIESGQRSAQASFDLSGPIETGVSVTENERDLFNSAFKVFYAERKIFATVNGYMGTAPWTMQEGDAVMLVAGAYVPYIFRPVGEGAWKLVGEAYCHGAMFGEDLAMEGLNFEMIRVI